MQEKDSVLSGGVQTPQAPAFRKPKMTLGRKLFIIGMLAVPIASFLLFYVYVNFNSILMAFQQTKNGQVVYTWENFRMLFRDFANPYSVMKESLVNTLIFFSVNLFIMIPLTAIFSYFIYKKIFGYKVFRVVFFLPSIISAVIMTMLYRYLLSVDGPVVALLVKMLHLEAKPEIFGDSRYALTAIVLYGIWTGFGSNLILFNGAISRIPEEVIEAGMLDGVGLCRELVQIVIPLIWPTLSTIIIFACVGIFTASGPILLFTKGEFGTYTISFWIFMQVYDQAAGGSYEYASAVGLFFTLIGFPIVMVVKHFLTKFGQDITY